MREAFALSALTQGTIVLLSYVIYFPDGPSLWAGLSDRVMFGIWCLTSLLSTVGFVSFSWHLVSAPDDGGPVYFLTIFPYATFLAASACYMPLATSGMKGWTMVVLALAATSAALLLYCSVLLFDGSYVTWLMGVLAFHCSVIDLLFWGFTWVYAEP